VSKQDQIDVVVSLRDEVASLRRRVKDLENMTGKQAKATADQTQVKPEPISSVVELRAAVGILRRQRDEARERAEKAEAEVADLQAQIRGVKRVLGVLPMPAENSFHKGKAA
jgi:hypothetical protein